MARSRVLFRCQECGHESARWLGNCPGCGAWNSFVEESGDPGGNNQALRRTFRRSSQKPVPVTEVSLKSEIRMITGMQEFDRVMGGGIMLGSLTLIAGDPGIGKSTLMTELARLLSHQKVLYVTGEESTRQVRLRAERMGVVSPSLYLFSETNVHEILQAVQDLEPELLIVDSIQTVFSPDITSAPGSVSQVRESAAALLGLTKDMDIPTFLVGHVTKEGSIAGPRVLEHMVDTVLNFEGDRHHSYRVLRAVKNRFGSTNEIGLFEMRDAGLRPVDNPSEIFLSERTDGASGSAVVCSLEGTRPILVEVQALVTPTSYGTPQRTPSGFDLRRLQMLLAVLEKRIGLRLSTEDVFLNVAGGVRLEEPAVDLGVLLAIASSFRNTGLDLAMVVVGEVGLSGEIRTVSHIDRRLHEASKLGFQYAVVPRANLKGITLPEKLEVRGVQTVSEAVDMVV